MTHYQKIFTQAIVLSIVIAFSPYKLIAYVLPWIAIGWILLFTQDKKVLLNLSIYSFVWFCFVAFHQSVNFQFALPNSFLAFVTYGNLAGILILTGKKLVNVQLLLKSFNVIILVTYIQAIIGISQAIFGFFVTGSFDKANGDFVEGTIHFAFSPSLTFANPMYAVNMAFCLIFIAVMYFYTRRGLGALILGSIAFILASVLHVIMFLFISAGISFLLYKRLKPVNFLQNSLVVLMAIMLVGSGAFLLRDNLETTYGIVNNLYQGNVTRSKVIQRVWNEMPNEYPMMSLVGVGPGQFSSRASLISSGLFLGGPKNPRSIPYFPVNIAQPLKDYLLEDWIRETDNPFQSSSSQPLFSWLSVYSEFGALIFFSIPFIFIFLFFKLRLRIKNSESRVMAIGAFTCLLLFFFLGFQENYWEIPQAMFLGVLLTKILFANTLIASKLIQNKH